MTEVQNDRKASRFLVERFAEHLLSAGLLAETDLADSESLARKIIEIGRKTNFVPIIDHTEKILNWAREFERLENFDLSIMMYATYFEHALNNVIDAVLSNKGISSKSKNSLIRSVNIGGKCGWLLEVLELPAFNASHAKFIEKLSGERNAFVHYKWDSREMPRSELRELAEAARRTVTYMKRYTSKALYGGRRTKLKKTLTRRSSRS